MKDLPFTLEDLRSKPVEHYLGYHTIDTMGYDFDDPDVQPFTLVTSNATEADDVSCWTDTNRNGFIWVIEGRKERSKRKYYLREVFRPTQKAKKLDAYFVGDKKKFDYWLEGEGVEFGDEILLNDLPWFPEFKKKNGSFGFGLRMLKDEAIKTEFLRLAQLNWPK